MRARFIGDPSDGFSGPQTITVWGHEFTKGEWCDVTTDKFARHSHFEFEAVVAAPRGRRGAKAEEAGE